jgi:uncharacterized protein
MNEIQRFVSDRTMAVVGLSANGKGFGNAAYTELKKRGFRLLPVHPTAESIQGDRCSARLSDLPEKVDRVLVVVKPGRAEAVVRDAAEAGIGQLWLQQGAESPAALSLAASHGLTVVSGQCILMFTEPVGSFHKLHRWIWKLLGKIPSS